MATTIIEKFAVALGFDFDPKGAEKFKDEFNGVVATGKKLVAFFAAATAAAVGFVAATTAVTDSQGKMADQIGISVDELDAWQHAASIAGDTADGVGTSLESLSIRMSEAKRGIGAGIEVFGLLGINATDAQGRLKDTNQMLLEISNRFQDFSKAEQIEFADKLGIRGSLRLLQQGPKVIRQYINEAKALGVTTKKDAAIAAEFQDNLVRIFRIIKDIAREITKRLAPIMSKMVKIFTDWWKINRKLLQQRLPEMLEKAAKYGKGLLLVLAVITSFKIISGLLSIISLIQKIGIFSLLTSGAIALIPAIIFTIIAAIGLLAQDAKVFFEGGDSFIGAMLIKFPKFREEILMAAKAFKVVWEGVILIKDGWIELFKVIKEFSFDSFLEVIKDIPIVIREIFSGLFDWITNIIGGFAPGLADKIREGFAIMEDLEAIIKVEFMKILNTASGFAEGLVKIISTIPEAIGKLFKTILPTIKPTLDTVGSIVSGLFKKVGLGKLLDSEGERTENEGSLIARRLAANLQAGKDFRAQLQPAAIPTAQNTTSNSTTNVDRGIKIDSININVDGAQSPSEVVSEFETKIQQALIDVQTNIHQ